MNEFEQNEKTDEIVQDEDTVKTSVDRGLTEHLTEAIESAKKAVSVGIGLTAALLVLFRKKRR